MKVKGTLLADVELMRVIAAFDGEAPPTLGDLAREFDVTRQCVHVRVKRLRGAGLVKTNEATRRVWGVFLSDSGKRLLQGL